MCLIIAEEENRRKFGKWCRIISNLRKKTNQKISK